MPGGQREARAYGEDWSSARVIFVAALVVLCTLIPVGGQLQISDELAPEVPVDRIFSLTVQVRILAARFPRRRFNLLVRLERQEQPGTVLRAENDTLRGRDGTFFATWGTKHYTTPINPFDGAYPPTDSLENLSRRYHNSEFPGFATAQNLVFNEEFQVCECLLPSHLQSIPYLISVGLAIVACD